MCSSLAVLNHIADVTAWFGSVIAIIIAVCTVNPSIAFWVCSGCYRRRGAIIPLNTWLAIQTFPILPPARVLAAPWISLVSGSSLAGNLPLIVYKMLFISVAIFGSSQFEHQASLRTIGWRRLLCR